MKENGRLTTCDLCGATVFSKCTGKGESDGGYTMWNNFEELPEGWGYKSDMDKTLCPECSAEYNSVMEAFISRRERKRCE